MGGDMLNHKYCKHGIPQYQFCTMCVREISDEIEIEKEAIRRLKRIAIDSIKEQPFYDLQQYNPFNLAASYAAKQMLVAVRTPYFKWQGPLQSIRRQPFFGVDSSLPTTIKIRRPVHHLLMENGGTIDLVETDSGEEFIGCTPAHKVDRSKAIEIGAISDHTAKHTPPFEIKQYGDLVDTPMADIARDQTAGVIDDVVQDSIRYGMGILKFDPRSVWKINKDDVDFWWGNGKAWPSAEEFRKNYEGAFKPRELKPKYQELSDQFHEMYGGDECCSCHINPPCLWCVHEGNPQNLNEDDNAWEPYP